MTGDRARWTALAIATFAQAMFSSVFVAVPVLLPSLRSRLDMTLGDVGLALAAVNLGMTVSLVPWGRLADRVGERRVLVVGLAGASLAFVAASLARDVPSLLGSLVCAGALGGSVNAGSTRAVMAWFPEGRGLALGIRQTAIPVGGGVFALLLPPLAALGAGAGFLALAAVMALAAAVSSGLRSRAVMELREAGGGRSPLRDARSWRIAVAGGTMLGGQVSVVGYVVLFFHDGRGMGTGTAAAVVAAMQAAGALLLVLVGRWSDRAGRRMAPLRLLGYAGAFSILLLAASADAPVAVTVLAAFVAGAISLSWVALCSAAAGESATPETSGAAMGLQQAAMAASATLVPIGFGAVLGATGWATAFAAAAAGPFVGALLLHGVADRPAEVAAVSG